MSIDLSRLELRINRDRNRFEAVLSESTSFVDYRLRGNQITMIHTEVPDALESNGIAGRLVRWALDYSREQGWTVKPYCPYVKAYIEEHPEYGDLVQSSQS